MTAAFYNRLSPTGKIGIKIPPDTSKEPDGPCLDICIAGSLQTKTRTYMKPKIPKKSDNIYRKVYIRTVKGFNYLYDVNTSIYIVSLLVSIDQHRWIDDNINKIKERVNKLI